MCPILCHTRLKILPAECVHRLTLRLVMLGAIVAGIHVGIRDTGYIPQSSTSPVLYPQHGWEVGEYIRCLVARPTDKEPYLEYNEGDMKGELMRKMEVRIWGEVAKTPKYFLCQRKETLIVCHLEKF